MSEADPLLDVRELSIAFAQGSERRTVVDRVSFRLEKGRALALVGESGSGKTVTAQAIVRLLPQPAASYPTGEIMTPIMKTTQHFLARVGQVNKATLAT